MGDEGIQTPMLSFAHTAGAGDIIHALPLVRALGGGELHIDGRKDAACDVFAALSRLLSAQPYVRAVHRRIPGAAVDFDLDAIWNDVESSYKSHAASYFAALKVEESPDWRRSWLSVLPRHPGGDGGFAVISRTARYREGSKIDWPWLVRKILARHRRAFFVGFADEHAGFVREVDADIPFLPTADLFETAGYIAASEALYSNQSACYAIAQGLGKPIFLETRPHYRKRAFIGLTDEYDLEDEE